MERRPTTASRLLLVLGLLLFAHPAAAADGSIRCRAVDANGRRIDGTCAATGPASRSCMTAGGTCTISAPPGTYTVTFRTRAGRTSTPRTARVLAGSTVTVVLTAATDPAVSYAHEGGDVTLQTMPTGTADAGTASTAPTDAGTASATPDAGSSTDTTTTTTTEPVASGGTVSGADAGTIVPADAGAETTTAVRVVQTATIVAQPAQPPDRSTGTTLALQGRTSDSRGRAIDGTVTVSKDGTPVGRAATAGGRFQLYDLPQGTLTLSFRSTAGATTTGTTRYSGSAVTINLTVPAP